MTSYKFRAMSVTGEPYIFTMLDIPTKITQDTFVLSLVPNSPILRYDTIVRGMDCFDLFEGDRIEVDGTEYTIVYQKGFVAMTDDRHSLKIADIKDYKVLSISSTPSKSLMFRYRGTTISIANIVGAYSDYVILNNVKGHIDPSEIQQDAAFSINRNRIFFGDLYNGYPVFMHKGCACIRVNGEVYDILSKHIPRREDT